jgi:tetratricopeptide (TPR) repeat protein
MAGPLFAFRPAGPSARRLALIAALATAVAGCAPKIVTPPAVTAPKFPDYVVPVAPPGLGSAAAVERHTDGWQWLQAGDLRAAERSFNAALKVAPGFYPAEAGLGYAALARKDEDAALDHFSRAVVANPRYAPALAGRGEALLAAGQRDAALQSFEAATAADPTLASLRSRIEVLMLRSLQDNVASARKSAEAGRLREARERYQRAIAASPQSAFLYRELALVERQDNDLDAALEHARKGAELDPTDARMLVLIGEILEARGAVDAAIESFSASLALEPNETLATRVEALRAKAALAAMPPEYQAIETSPTVTRAQLAALLGVRLDAVLKRAGQRTAAVITDTRGSWASPWILAVARAGVMEVYPNHTFQPGALVRRADLARAASRVLALIADERPALGSQWRSAARRRFPDVPAGHLSYPAVSLVVAAGVMTPQPDGTFELTRPATGEEAMSAVRKLEEVAAQRAR